MATVVMQQTASMVAADVEAWDMSVALAIQSSIVATLKLVSCNTTRPFGPRRTTTSLHRLVWINLPPHEVADGDEVVHLEEEEVQRRGEPHKFELLSSERLYGQQKFTQFQTN